MAVIFGTSAPETLVGGADPDELYGFDGNDSLVGGGGVDTLVGGAGADTMNGGDGYDIYYVDNAGDVIVEGGFPGGLIVTSVSYSLVPYERNINEIRAFSGTAPINLTGGDYPEALIGNDGANRIDGGNAIFSSARDTLQGLGGDDTYIVYNTNNIVFEDAGQGNDTVLIALDPRTATINDYFFQNTRFPNYNAEVEIVAMADPASTQAFRIIGNTYAQSITGNAGANTLSGGGGADTLIGLGGNDSYLVDVTQPVTIREAAGGGTDTVALALTAFADRNTFILNGGAEIEAVTISGGTVAANVTGNEFSQSITGNNGDNIINGFGGADTMIGLGGNDQYLVRGPGDVVIEANGGGTDTVFTTVSYNLGVNEVEVLSTVTNADTTPIDLIGNFATQTVVGNYGNNVLNGGSGGLDTLIGLRGDDVYAVGDSRTVIVENAGEGTDTVVVAVDYSLAAGVSVEVLAAQDRSGTVPLALRGNEVAQTIAGNAGNNVIDGGLGNDTLIGGAGADLFVFSTALGANNVDAIADFGTGDRIGLSQSIFGIAAVNALNFTTGAAATTADQRIVYNQATGQLFYDADGNSAGAASLFALLAPGTPLTGANFEIV